LANQVGVAFGCAEYDVAPEAVAKRKVNNSSRCMGLQDACEIRHVLLDRVFPAHVS
jgi:hypothetical protein